MISIIIPTLNEEKYLPFLLDSIKKQTVVLPKGKALVKLYEIIVADAGSTDATLAIAKKYGCKIVAGGLPARGRNNGAKVAKGDLLFFLDADTILPTDDFLKKTLIEYHSRKLDIASFCLYPFPKRKLSYFLVDTFYNKPIVVAEKILPHGAVGIMIKKELFEKLNGYDESIKLSEDHDLARRAAKIAKFGIIRQDKLLVSDRRFIKDGWLSIGVKYFLCELYMIFIGPVKTDIFKYKFNHYDNDTKN